MPGEYSDSVNKWFNTGWGVGGAIAQGMEQRAKKRAGKLVSETQAIPAPGYKTSDQQDMNYDGAMGGIPADKGQLGGPSFTPEQMNVKYGTDLVAWRKRRQDALNEYAAYVPPEELTKLQDAYDAKTVKTMQNGITEAATMLEMGGDPNQIADMLTKAYAQHPSQTNGIASVVKDPATGKDTVVMSFFDNATGKVRATVPMNDPQKLLQMAAAINDPQWLAKNKLDERTMQVHEKNARTQLESVNNTNNNAIASNLTKLLTDNATYLSAMAKHSNDMGADEEKRVNALEKSVQSLVKDQPEMYEDNGSYHRQIAAATDFARYNNAPAAQGVQQLQKFDGLFMPRVTEILKADPKLWEQYKASGYMIPPDASAQALKDMVDKEILNIAKDGSGAIYMQDGKKQIRIPPLISGQDGASNLGYSYSLASNYVYGGNPSSGGLSQDQHDVIMKRIFELSGIKVPAGPGGAIPGGQAGQGGKLTPFDSNEQKNMIAAIDRIMATGAQGVDVRSSLGDLLDSARAAYGPEAADMLASYANAIGNAPSNVPTDPTLNRVAPNSTGIPAPGQPQLGPQTTPGMTDPALAQIQDAVKNSPKITKEDISRMLNSLKAEKKPRSR